MITKIRLTALVGSVVLLFGCSTSGREQTIGDERIRTARVTEQVRQASYVYRDLITAPDGGIPEELLRRAKCVAVLPRVLKGAFVFGGRYGSGLVSCIDAKQQWTPPAFFRLTGSSLGLQIGAEATDLVLFFVGDHAEQMLLEGTLAFGADIKIAAGPVGRSVEGKTDFSSAQIYAYAQSSGIFAGVSLEGAILRPDLNANEAFYGKHLTMANLFYEGDSVSPVPNEAKSFVRLLP